LGVLQVVIYNIINGYLDTKRLTMGIKSILKKVKAYYNKDGYAVSIEYKGHPLSATGSTEDSVIKSLMNLMNFVDYMEAKKVIENKEIAETV
jgi:hypothetical protein